MKNRLFSIVLTLSLLFFFAGANSFAGGVKTQKKEVKTEKKVDQTKMTDQKKDQVKGKTTMKTHKRRAPKKNIEK